MFKDSAVWEGLEVTGKRVESMQGSIEWGVPVSVSLCCGEVVRSGGAQLVCG